uniref:Crooked neck protein n=1 Tax=Solanum lycopersicum TaxID=4081 RepID=A0A3Q7JBI6_SOLLC
DLAVTFCPKIDQLLYKYIYMKEMMLNNVAGARQVFERWITWTPAQKSWLFYIEFELRYNETDKAREFR